MNPAPQNHPSEPIDEFQGPSRVQCHVCHAPAPPRTGRTGPPPSVHDPCRRWHGNWNVAERALEEIEFPDTPEGDLARDQIASELFAAANAIRAGRWGRGEGGRFNGPRVVER